MCPHRRSTQEVPRRLCSAPRGNALAQRGPTDARLGTGRRGVRPTASCPGAAAEDLAAEVTCGMALSPTRPPTGSGPPPGVPPESESLVDMQENDLEKRSPSGLKRTRGRARILPLVLLEVFSWR